MRFSGLFYRAVLLAILNLSALSATAQVQDGEAWTRFEKKVGADYQYGYRDASGRVRFPATFGPFTNALRFRHIIAVQDAHSLKSFYLLKSGRQVGRDSVYMSGDYEVACESEGKIVFKDWRKDRVGFFNAQGRLIIPAIYNYATPFHNGLAGALIGARRACWGNDLDTLHCEHRTWAGGHTVLINERNEVLVNDFSTTQLDVGGLDWYSLKVNIPVPDTATTVSFRAVSGDYYTFTAYKKEFTHWLYEVFVPAVRVGMAAAAPLCFEEVALTRPSSRREPRFERAVFAENYYASILRPKLGQLTRTSKNVMVFSEDLNPLLFTGSRFHPFFTDCGEHFREKYPVFEVILTYPGAAGSNSIDHQEHFEFIRTSGGYRLFSVAL